MSRLSTTEVADLLLETGALDIRDVDAGQDPFLYSSGMKGPGYVMVKAVVGWSSILTLLIRDVALEVAQRSPSINFVAANATGGMIPGWELAKGLGLILGRHVPCIYVRGTRKKGGHGELFTGLAKNPFIQRGNEVLVVEELVNMAETTVNSTLALRDAGYKATNAACILTYDHDMQRNALKANNIELASIITLAQLIARAEERQLFAPHLFESYREFRAGPQAWMDARGITKDEKGGTF